MQRILNPNDGRVYLLSDNGVVLGKPHRQRDNRPYKGGKWSLAYVTPEARDQVHEVAG